MRYAYRAFDLAGKTVSDVVEAADAGEATEQLRRRGLFVAEVREAGGAGGGGVAAETRGGGFSLGGGGRVKKLALFTRQLAVLISTSTPVVEAIAALEKQTPDPAWRAVIADVRQKIEEGASLSDAMRAHPKCFDSVCCSLIQAGESSGQLDSMLERLAALTRQQQHVRSSLAGAMVYPCLLTVVGVGVLVLMLTFVLPRFAGLFETLKAPLPPTTEILMQLSALMIGHWYAFLVAPVGIAFGLRAWAGSAAGRRSLHSWVLRAPQVGRMARSFSTARVARLLGVLLVSKVPLVEALQLTRQGTANLCYADLLARAEEAVTRGESVSVALAGGGLISPSVCEAVRNGEKAGRVGEVLVSIADYMDEDNEVVVRSLTSILEPVILIVLGVVVGTVALSMFMPLFDLASMTQQGGGGGS